MDICLSPCSDTLSTGAERTFLFIGPLNCRLVGGASNRKLQEKEDEQGKEQKEDEQEEEKHHKADGTWSAAGFYSRFLLPII